jgi:hypothetical protein
LISPLRARAIIAALAIFNCFGLTLHASADETKIRVGALDAVLTVPADVERPPVALLIAGSGSTDRDRQVARLDFVALGAASPVAKTLWLPDMNHMLVDVADEADDVAAYNQPERALDTVLIDSVADFVLANGVR